MRVWTHYEMEQFNIVYSYCLSVSLAYDKHHKISLSQIRCGMPTKEYPKAYPLPDAFINLITKVKGLDNFADLFRPINKQSTMQRLIKYLCDNHVRDGHIHVRDFELMGGIWIDREKKRAVEIVFKGKNNA